MLLAQPTTVLLLTLPLCWLLWREWHRLRLACDPLSRRRRSQPARREGTLARHTS